MKYLVLLSALIGVGLLVLLASASSKTALYAENYAALFGLTGVLALGLLILVSYQIWQLRGKLLRQEYGAKLALRLAVFFSLIAVLPGVLLYAISVQSLEKSIESWFDVRVEKALEGSMSLARSTLENGLDELEKKSRHAALILAEQPPRQYAATLQRFVTEGLARQAAVFERSGQPVVVTEVVVTEADKTVKWEVSPALLEEAWLNGQYRGIDTLSEGQLVLRVIVPIRSERWGERLLQFIHPVPSQMAEDAETVRTVYGEYQQLSLSRLGLKRLYGITLTFSLLIVLLSALSAAFYLSARLSAPLAVLASGTRAAARGDFSGNFPVYSNDELGGLTVLFNQMMAQLANAKKLNELQQQQVEEAKSYLESILAHLSSGVLVVDKQGVVRTNNTSACRILGVGSDVLEGRTLQQLAEEHPLLRPFVEAIQDGIAQAADDTDWQRQIDRPSKNGTQALLLHGSRVSSAMGPNDIVVFDDITQLLQAQRQAAWGEVARRLAHEIKNPLTPIRLSAERLQHKLAAKLEEADAQLLQRATATIVNQVDAMKSMVSDFADYARAPSAQMVVVDLHQLVREVAGLYEANHIPLALHLKATHPLIRGDANRLRQVLHNLLQNAQDALQQTTDPRITLATADAENDRLHLSVTDNGCGIPENFLARVFEPYATTKPKGTGLGLSIVKKIIEEHGGSIAIQSKQAEGTRIEILLPTQEQEGGKRA